MIGWRSTYFIAALAFGAAVVPAKSQETIKIGAPLALSGKFVSYGAAAKRGIEMAVDIYGGKVANKKIEMLFRDTQSDAQAAVNFFTQLLSEEKVNYLVGPIATPMAMAVCGVAGRTKALWVVPGRDHAVAGGGGGQGTDDVPYLPLCLPLSHLARETSARASRLR